MKPVFAPVWDALNGKYKEVIVMRYVRGYSWAKISARLGTADSTARDWHTRAMERLGEVLEELPEAEALARRASRATYINKRQKILDCPAGLSKGCFAD